MRIGGNTVLVVAGMVLSAGCAHSSRIVSRRLADRDNKALTLAIAWVMQVQPPGESFAIQIEGKPVTLQMRRQIADLLQSANLPGTPARPVFDAAAAVRLQAERSVWRTAYQGKSALPIECRIVSPCRALWKFALMVPTIARGICGQVPTLNVGPVQGHASEALRAAER
jgi:hypothetical protein